MSKEKDPTMDNLHTFTKNTESLPDTPSNIEEDSAPEVEFVSEFLIKKVVCPDEEFDFEEASGLLAKACTIDGFQIAYSEIYRILKVPKDMTKIVGDSLLHCQKLRKNNGGIESNRILSKISEHIKLCQLEISQMLELSEIISESNRVEIDKSNRETTKGITSQLIGVLSIFTALAFVLFGGISGLSSINELVSIGENSITTMLICFLLFGLIMLGCLCLFVYFILQIIKPSKEGFPLKKITLCVIVPMIVVLILLLIFSKIPFASTKWVFHFWKKL